MAVEHVYMMAIMPPPALADTIDAIRKEFAEAYNCKAGLKPPVHITLYPPYKEMANHEEEVKQVLSKWLAIQRPFDLSLRGFDTFRKNGVIYINVVVNEQLKQLHKVCSTQMTKILQPMVKNNQPYHPHFTIGYRDIPKEVFPEAVKDYLPRKFEASFTVDTVYFWKHNGSNWETIAAFPFTGGDDSVRQPSLF